MTTPSSGTLSLEHSYLCNVISVEVLQAGKSGMQGWEGFIQVLLSIICNGLGCLSFLIGLCLLSLHSTSRLFSHSCVHLQHQKHARGRA